MQNTQRLRILQAYLDELNRFFAEESSDGSKWHPVFYRYCRLFETDGHLNRIRELVASKYRKSRDTVEDLRFEALDLEADVAKRALEDESLSDRMSIPVPRGTAEEVLRMHVAKNCPDELLTSLRSIHDASIEGQDAVRILEYIDEAAEISSRRWEASRRALIGTLETPGEAALMVEYVGRAPDFCMGPVRESTSTVELSVGLLAHPVANALSRHFGLAPIGDSRFPDEYKVRALLPFFHSYVVERLLTERDARTELSRYQRQMEWYRYKEIQEAGEDRSSNSDEVQLVLGLALFLHNNGFVPLVEAVVGNGRMDILAGDATGAEAIVVEAKVIRSSDSATDLKNRIKDGFRKAVTYMNRTQQPRAYLVLYWLHDAQPDIARSIELQSGIVDIVLVDGRGAPSRQKKKTKAVTVLEGDLRAELEP